jgi:hypothetical protein
VTVLLRPEQLAAEPLAAEPHAGGEPRAGSGPHAGGEPRATARVVAVSFHGHDALLGVQTAQGTSVQVRMLGGALPRPGDRVALTVRGPAWALAGDA